MSKRLVVCITTSQSPHIEAMFHYIKKNIDEYEKIFIVDFLPQIKYRHEIKFRKYLPLKLVVSRYIRNGLNKCIYIYFKKKSFNEKVVEIFPKYSEKNEILDNKEVFNILKTYSSTEWGAPSIRLNKYTYLVKKDIEKISGITKYITNEIQLNKDDEVLIFNGRMPVENTVLTTLRKMGYNNIIFHECNNYQKKIYYIKHGLHDLEKYSDQIQEYYKKYKITVIEDWMRFKKISTKKATKKFVTYFTSNTDEFQFSYEKPINQSRIIENLLKLNFINFKLKIRVHPNTINKSIEVKRYWMRMKELYPDIFINYDEMLSSYQLCKESIVTISIGSSMAAESILLGTPHILIGNQNWYYKFPGYIKTEEDACIKELKNFMEDYSLNPLRYEPTLEEKRYAASCIMFDKRIGEEIGCAALGSYPIRRVIDDFS